MRGNIKAQFRIKEPAKPALGRWVGKGKVGNLPRKKLQLVRTPQLGVFKEQDEIRN